MFDDFLGYFDKHYFWSKTGVANFSAILEKNWATFYSNIWSRWQAYTIILELTVRILGQDWIAGANRFWLSFLVDGVDLKLVQVARLQALGCGAGSGRLERM